MWISTRERKPEKDGFYLVQMICGDIAGFSYTTDGGWNTRRYPGELWTDAAISDANIARWFDAPQPPKVPAEWLYEFMHNAGR